jgi:uncharacterized protein (DUF362 family)
MKKNMNSMNRREFLRSMCLAGASAVLASCNVKTGELPATGTSVFSQSTDPVPSGTPSITAGLETQLPGLTPTPEIGQAYLAVARGENPAANTTAALAALGGMERFVKSGADVIIKPNICTDYYPFEYAATTNPEVVAALVQLCFASGAGRVRVMDYPFGGSAQSAYERSGIASAVAAVGGEMEVMNSHKFINTPIPLGQDLLEWKIYEDILNADMWINVPIAKDHGLAGLTLGGKNLLGVIENRSGIHGNFGERIADLVSVLRPALTVVDATRILMDNGPTGGNLNDVQLCNTIIASHDIVSADAYAATLFGLRGEDIAYVKACAGRGYGTIDLNSIQIEEIAV